MKFNIKEKRKIQNNKDRNNLTIAFLSAFFSGVALFLVVGKFSQLFTLLF